MSFGPESDNPREKRAYAHAVIARARQTGTLDDFYDARTAIAKAGDSKKAKATHFEHHLVGVARTDESTRIIIDKAREVLDPVKTLRFIEANVRSQSDPLYLTSHRRHSAVFSSLDSKGASMGRTEVIDPSTGEVVNSGDLTATDLEGDRMAHRVPTDWNGNLDVTGIRRLPDAERTTLAVIASKIS